MIGRHTHVFLFVLLAAVGQYSYSPFPMQHEHAQLVKGLDGVVSVPIIPNEKPSVVNHGKEFWREIVKNRYAIPQGQPVFPLVRELSGYLGSTDSELRDDLTYSILDVWILYKNALTVDELSSLSIEWQGNLRSGIGESRTDTIFRRSYSALCLAILAERNLKERFLGDAQYRVLLDAAFAYLKDERDLRGFDPAKGWIHATAHTADLLGFLASDARFTREDQSRLLQAVAERLSSAHQIFSYGEQDRLAAAISSIVVRSDFDSAGFDGWLKLLAETDAKLWKDSPPQDALLKTFENNNYFLQALVARLSSKPAAQGVAHVMEQVNAVMAKR